MSCYCQQHLTSVRMTNRVIGSNQTHHVITTLSYMTQPIWIQISGLRFEIPGFWSLPHWFWLSYSIDRCISEFFSLLYLHWGTLNPVRYTTWSRTQPLTLTGAPDPGTHMLVVLNLLQGLDLPQSLVGDTVLQPPQSHFLQSHRLSCLTDDIQYIIINTFITDKPKYWVRCRLMRHHRKTVWRNCSACVWFSR